MRQILKISAVLSFVAMVSVVAPLHADAAINSWIKGASITPESPTEFDDSSFEQSLVNLKATNANSVSLVIPLYQSNTQSTDVGSGFNTPTDESLVTAITEAHALGFSVTLKPHLDPLSGEWRAYIDPSNRTAWFAAYDAQILHYAALAQANHVEMFIVGTELVDMSTDSHNPTNTANWQSLIQHVRAIYNGKLTYAANWGPNTINEKDGIDFWNSLDYAGIDAYYPLGTTNSSDSIPSLLAAWNTWDKTDITPFAQKVGKPVIFTEVGYKSVTGAHGTPGDYSYNNTYDGTEQANDYTALFSYWSQNPYIAGMSFWQWDPNPSAGGSGDTNYTPQNKLAQSVIATWYGGNGVPYSAPSISVSAIATTSSVVLGQPVTVTAVATNTGGEVSGALTDIEIYDAAGARVYQSFAPNETIGSTTVPYTISWTPVSAGTYTVKLGVFSGDWSTSYAWNNQAESISVGNSAPVLPEAFTASVGTIASSSLVLNQPVSITGSVTDTGGDGNALVDIEVYSSAGQKVFQKFFDNEQFASNSTKIYPVSWTPSSYDTYHVSIGVFTPGWASTYLWTNQAQTFTIAAAAPPVPPTPPTTSSTIQVWWPTTSSSISGTVPFKAILNNLSLDAYDMFWQVDGGALNSMYDSAQDYPHKETYVNVAGWNWNGTGPYQLTFVAKSKDGTTIATQVVPVTIAP